MLTRSWLLLFLLLPAAGAAQKPAEQKPAPAAAAVSDYLLGPGDVLEVFVWKEPDLHATPVVRPDGKISLPLAGELHVAGKTALQVRDNVVESLRQYLANPVVNVIVKEINSQRISVLGQVRKPDSYRVNHKVTVLEAIAMAGGFTDFAKRDKITVIRNGSTGKQTFKLSLDSQVKKDGGAPFYLLPSDTVYVE